MENIEQQGNSSNPLTAEFKKWESVTKTTAPIKELAGDTGTLVEKYEKVEDTVLNNLEYFLSYMDNFIAIQAIFPSFEKLMKKSPILRPFNVIIKQIAKIYIFMILIYLKKFIVKLRKINKLIRIVKLEYEIIEKSFQAFKNLNPTKKSSNYHEKCLNILYTEKAKAIIEIIGYFNDLILNFSLVSKRAKLGRFSGKIVGFISWLVNVYRLCRDEKSEEENEQRMKEIAVRFDSI